jgi:hypothetical protein
MFAMVLLEIDDLKFFKIVIFLHLTAMATAVSSLGNLILLLKVICS